VIFLKRFSLLFITVLLSGVLFACSSPSESAPRSASPAPPPGSTPAPAVQKLAKLNGKATVVLTVNGKPITIEVDGVNAPITAGNFVDLVQRQVYDQTVFHRVEPGFVAQGGDPQGKDPQFPANRLGTGGFIDPATKQERNIPLEIWAEGGTKPVYSQTLKEAGGGAPKLKHRRGAVAMARTPLPDSASSQFYITLNPVDFLDGDYAVFGYVTQGMEVVDQIKIGDRITSAKVMQGLDKLAKP
jgi:peptidyl-prolyl cis-trans isomerase B (cyclophilin B)